MRAAWRTRHAFRSTIPLLSAQSRCAGTGSPSAASDRHRPGCGLPGWLRPRSVPRRAAWSDPPCAPTPPSASPPEPTLSTSKSRPTAGPAVGVDERFRPIGQCETSWDGRHPGQVRDGKRHLLLLRYNGSDYDSKAIFASRTRGVRGGQRWWTLPYINGTSPTVDRHSTTT